MEYDAYVELLHDKMLLVDDYKRIHFKRLINYIQSILLEYDEPEVIRTEVYISESKDHFNVDMITNDGAFSFVANRPVVLGVSSNQFKYSHNYLPNYKIIDFHGWIHPSMRDIITLEVAARYWSIDLTDYMKLCELGLVRSKNVHGHWIVSKYESPRLALDEMLSSVNNKQILRVIHGDELPIRANITVDADFETKTIGELYSLK
jgi:hypothetical protein